MGLSFSVPQGEKLPSSLLNIFKELQKDVGCSIPRHGNLQKWAVQVNGVFCYGLSTYLFYKYQAIHLSFLFYREFCC